MGGGGGLRAQTLNPRTALTPPNPETPNPIIPITPHDLITLEPQGPKPRNSEGPGLSWGFRVQGFGFRFRV